MSRVAVMTGLTRKDVKRLRDKIDAGHHAIVAKTTPLATILHRWNSEEEFLDENGRPATLPFLGERNSFSALVKKFGGDIPPGAMRTELKRIQAIVEDDDGNLTAIKRAVHPKAQHEYLAMALMHSAYALLSNIAHNTDPNKKGPNWAQYTAYTRDIPPSEFPKLMRISEDRLVELASSFDDLFMGFERDGNSGLDANESGVVAVGFYYFEERETQNSSVWNA